MVSTRVDWTAPTPDEVDGPGTGPDRPLLEAYLGYQRRTLHNICAGLSPDQLALRPLPSTNLSLLGIVRHMAKVERIWFRIRIAREDVAPLFDPALGKDYDFEHIDPADAPTAFDTLAEETRLAELAAADASFDDTVNWPGGDWSVRMIYVHMIAEYARHNGHADLLRESVDGETGE